jgi:HTH-type transcriptional repressor of NAD biosynthesis genes
MKPMTGLTLGKFAPLHKGHQYMIETAIAETSHLIVVVYDAPEVTPIPLGVRASWIRTLYPGVEVIEGKNAPSAMGNTPEIEKIQEDYILGLLCGRKISHFYSSEFYGKHMSRALGAINRTIDINRNKIPISGTAIRENPYLNKEYLPQVVYRDLLTNIVFLGAPSTGKTTMAEALSKKYNTQWMPEFGREYWEKNQINRRLNLQQLVEVAEGHLEREEEHLSIANKYLFTDTNAITTYMFSLYFHGKAEEKLIKLAQLAEKRYDLVFVCDTDIPYEDTWDRSGDMNRKAFQTAIVQDLVVRKIRFEVLKGDLSERIGNVAAALDEFQKYGKYPRPSHTF